jgi:DMSO/TMAO reductase YedYZ molybdopterin-dependent catalytic subunit
MNAAPRSRRRFLRDTTLAGAAAASLLSRGSTPAAGAKAAAAPACPHPFLTKAEDFYTVARGEPRPSSLTGQAQIDAGLTPKSWRLEITADPFTEPPIVTEAARIERSFTRADGTALDLPRLMELGKKHTVRFIKALQCLNIPEPLGQGLWEGVPLREVLRLCGRLQNVRRIYYRGFHNHDPKQVFQSSLSYTQAMETPPGEPPVFLAYRLNGEPIPPIRGGPVRMIVPWAHGFKNIKWLNHIFLTNDHRANDTYALKNNDPESALKTAAYMDEGPDKIAAGQPVLVTGQVISGLSGLKHVECWLRRVQGNAKPLADDDAELLRAPWQQCELFPPPDWSAVLPAGVAPRDVSGFDDTTGQPRTWPPRYGMAAWHITYRDLPAGRYEVRARAVDLNGFAQPEPRPVQKSGKNAIQVRRFEVV